MGSVFVFRGIKFFIYPGDHLPPHVHVVGPDFELKVKIADLVVIRMKGKLRSKDIKMLLQQIGKRRDDLMEVWNEWCND